MDIHNSDSKEIRNSPKTAKISDNGKDFISDLPDAIPMHILSFLPIKDAINTVLLRRFGDLWRSIEVLDFNSCLYHDCRDAEQPPDVNEKFLDLIHHVLNLHESTTLDKLCLRFCFTLTYTKDRIFRNIFYDELEWEKGTAIQIEKLIRYAMNRKVKVLDLNLKGCHLVIPGEFYDMPDVLSSNYLTCLKLTAFDITSCKTIDLKSLRVLLLDEVSLSDDIMEEVLLGCPSLEDMSLVDCYGLRKFSCQNPNLKKLMIRLATWEKRRVIISCPCVLSLEICGRIERACLLDVSSVVDASIFFSCLFRCKKKPYDNFSRLLQKFRPCKTFSPCSESILVMTIWNFTNVPCPSFDWKNLILNLSLTKWHHPGLSLLLRNSQSLETLTMYIYPGWDDIFTTKEAQWIQAYEFDGENYWDSQEATFPCLESIMIYGYVNEPYVIQMVKFLLKSATRLQKLVISTKKSLQPTRESWFFGWPIERPKFTPEQLQELSQKFASLPRASPEATICFS